MHRVVNFYDFQPLTELPALREHLAAEALARGLRGTILLAPEGINASVHGETAKLADFMTVLRQDPRFAHIVGKESLADAAAFRRLVVRIKRWIIRFAEADDPGLAEIQAAPRISPEELRQLLRDRPEDVVLIDTRNDYEHEYGRFRGASVLPIDRFTEFGQAFEAQYAEEKAGKTFIFYCTGGIRCEKAVPWATKRGFADVRQLDGGILGYFEACGDEGFDGRLFVFDRRWIIDGTRTEAQDDAADRIQPKPAKESSHG